MLVPILLLALGFILLIKGGDWFVDGASGIARRFHLPEILIGATVVSIGTTLPEVMVSAGAALQGSGDIAYGNAIGSIICNTALISAITITLKPGEAARKSMILPVSFFFGAAVFYSIMSYCFGFFSRLSGIILLAAFVLYMVMTVLRMKSSAATLATVGIEEQQGALTSEAELEAASGEDHVVESAKAGTKDSLLKDIILLVIGAVLIAFGADLLVDNAIIIAQQCGVSEKVIGLTIVALGTSLPELVTAITSLIKGHGSLSLGNIIGANLFNLVLVSGAAITINPFKVPAASYIGGINTSLIIDIPVMFAVMLILTVPTLIKQKLSRWQGISLLLVYAAFCVLQFCI
ncbi:MAG: calcium/sodium antiporter [Acutalibacteraceae bacterium]|nr:calcium/sodium antiporter [Acutalibacteraceae bacterium]